MDNIMDNKDCGTCSRAMNCNNDQVICIEKYQSLRDELENSHEEYCRKLESELQACKKKLTYYKLKVEVAQYEKAINDIKTLITDNENYYTDEIFEANIISQETGYVSALCVTEDSAYADNESERYSLLIEVEPENDVF